MFGALKKLGGAAGPVAPSHGLALNGMPGLVEGINRAQELSQKLADATKAASGADKASLDRKLGALQSTLRGDLEKAPKLAENAARDGEPQAPRAAALLNEGLAALTGDGGQAA
jgi:hypothetical protein